MSYAALGAATLCWRYVGMQSGQHDRQIGWLWQTSPNYYGGATAMIDTAGRPVAYAPGNEPRYWAIFDGSGFAGWFWSTRTDALVYLNPTGSVYVLGCV